LAELGILERIHQAGWGGPEEQAEERSDDEEDQDRAHGGD
jgi:hypothetical protein